MARLKRLYAAVENRLYDIFHSGKLLTLQVSPVNSAVKATTPTDWYLLKTMFEGMEFNRDDLILDVGCGTGRTLIFFARRYPEANIAGIELNSDVAELAKANVPMRCNVIVGDVTRDCPQGVTVFYLFNPFHDEVMRDFCNKVLNCVDKFTLIYVVPVNLQTMKDTLSGDVEIHIHKVTNTLRALDCEYAVVTKHAG